MNHLLKEKKEDRPSPKGFWQRMLEECQNHTKAGKKPLLLLLTLILL